MRSCSLSRFSRPRGLEFPMSVGSFSKRFWSVISCPPPVAAAMPMPAGSSELTRQGSALDVPAERWLVSPVSFWRAPPGWSAPSPLCVQHRGQILVGSRITDWAVRCDPLRSRLQAHRTDHKPFFHEQPRRGMRRRKLTIYLADEHATPACFPRDGQVKKHTRDLAPDTRALRLGFGHGEQQLALASPEVT